MAKTKYANQKEKNALFDLREKQKKEKKSMSMGETEGETGETEDADAASFSTVFGLLDEIPKGDDLPDISTSLEQGLKTDLIGQTGAMLQLTGKEAKKQDIRNIVFHSEEITKSKYDAPTEAMTTIEYSYNRLLEHCDHYIGDRNPWSKMGKQRLAIVKAIRFQAAWERDLITKHARNVMAKDTYHSFNEVLEHCRDDVYSTIMSKADNAFGGSDRTGKNGAEVKESIIKEASLLGQYLARTYGISMEDAMLLANSRKDIDKMDKFLGGEGISRELMEKLIFQLKDKKAKQRTFKSFDDDGALQVPVEKATEYAEKTLGVSLDRTKTNYEHQKQFLFEVMKQGDDEETIAQNAALIVNLAGGDKVEAAWSDIYDKYLHFDLSKFDDRSPENILDHYEELRKQTYLGFIYKRHILPGLKGAGLDVSDEQQSDMDALYSFYQSLHGYLESIQTLYNSEDAMLADSEKMDTSHYEEMVNERTQGDYGSFFERASADFEEQSGKLHQGNWQIFGSKYFMHYQDAFYTNRSAIDILRKDFGWKSDKDPKDTKMIFKKTG